MQCWRQVLPNICINFNLSNATSNVEHPERIVYYPNLFGPSQTPTSYCLILPFAPSTQYAFSLDFICIFIVTGKTKINDCGNNKEWNRKNKRSRAKDSFNQHSGSLFWFDQDHVSMFFSLNPAKLPKTIYCMVQTSNRRFRFGFLRICAENHFFCCTHSSNFCCRNTW